MNSGFWAGRRVLVTGHTGFKGAWLVRWLRHLGAVVSGYALPAPTEPSLAQLLGPTGLSDESIADVRDPGALRAALIRFRPDVVLHLAAQSLVRASYESPGETWEINVQGTVNLLEAVRACPGVRACVVVTSDKCYENREWEWPYRESDTLGGYDPYSSSKGAVELACASWRRSYLAGSSSRLATARAGNVIGGGDWSRERLVPDFVAAVLAGRPVRLRNPDAVRPWQHVLEPLSGYLRLAEALCGPDGDAYADAWNFGPRDDGVATVGELARLLVASWGEGSLLVDAADGAPHEARMLRLDCARAAARLGWRGRWGLRETVSRTAAWYRAQSCGAAAADLVDADIAAYSGTLSAEILQ